jgi:hypothetical protein
MTEHITKQAAPQLDQEQRNIANAAIDTQLRAMGIDPSINSPERLLVTVDVMRAMEVER